MHLNSDLAMEGIVTDGFLAVIERGGGGEIKTAGLHNASYLKAGGRTLFSSLLKCDALLRFGRDGVGVHARLTAPTLVHVAAARDAAVPLKRVKLPAGESFATVER